MGSRHLYMTPVKAFPIKLNRSSPGTVTKCRSASGPAASQLLYVNQKQFIATVIAKSHDRLPYC